MLKAACVFIAALILLTGCSFNGIYKAESDRDCLSDVDDCNVYSCESEDDSEYKLTQLKSTGKTSSNAPSLPDLGEYLECESEYDYVYKNVHKIMYEIKNLNDKKEADRITDCVIDLMEESEYDLTFIESEKYNYSNYYYFEYTGSRTLNKYLYNENIGRFDVELSTSYLEYDNSLDIDIYYHSNVFKLVDPGKKLASEAEDQKKEKSDGKSDSKKQSGKHIAEPIDDAEYKITKSSVYVQDLAAYAESSLSLKNISKENDDFVIYNFDGKADALEVLEAYIRKITNGSYNLKLVDTYESSYKHEAFYDYCIEYTGKGSVPETSTGIYSQTKCDIMAYATIDIGSLEGHLYIPKSMEIVDLGLRYSGPDVSTGLGGESATAGLYKKSDGTYSTSDGRLKAKLGKAMVLRDGKSYTVDATRKKDGSSDELWVDPYYKSEGIYFVHNEDVMMTGDIMRRQDLRQAESKKWSSLEQFSHVTLNPLIGFGHGDDFITPTIFNNNRFKDLTVRMMYYKKDVVAVYYIYAEFYRSPKEIEALCVVDCNPKNVEVETHGGSSGGGSVNDSDHGFVPDHSKPDCLSCHGDGKCTKCGGNGYLWSSASDKEDRNCTSCSGTGRCFSCGGTGKR